MKKIIFFLLAMNFPLWIWSQQTENNADSLQNSAGSQENQTASEENDFNNQSENLNGTLPLSETPEALQGIWKGSDRYIFLGKENQICIILETFYGWYYDVAAVSKTLEPSYTRDHNDSSSWESQYPYTSFRQLKKDCPAWEMTIHFDSKKSTIIPLCIINNEIYMNFLIRQSLVKDLEQEYAYPVNQEEPQIEEENNYGFWQGVNHKESIKISEQPEQENINSYFITDKAIYSLRFWQTDMKYDMQATAAFNDSENIYRIPKHLNSGGRIYTCATGKRGRIRNVNRFQKFPDDFTVDSSKNIIAIGKPLFTKEKGPENIENLMKIVSEANSRRAPWPSSKFEKHKVNWNWDLIWTLDKDNSLFRQAVSEEQYRYFRLQETD